MPPDIDILDPFPLDQDMSARTKVAIVVLMQKGPKLIWQHFPHLCRRI